MAMAAAGGWEAAAEAPPVSPSWDEEESEEEPEDVPVRKVRCPQCRAEIPVWSEEQTIIVCQECGKKGRIRPMKKQTLPPMENLEEEEETMPPPPLMAAGRSRGAPGRQRQPPRQGAGARAATAPIPMPPQRPARKQPPGRPQVQQTGKRPLKTVTCSGCGGKVPVFTNARPVKITCSTCGKSGTLRM